MRYLVLCLLLTGCSHRLSVEVQTLAVTCKVNYEGMKSCPSY